MRLPASRGGAKKGGKRVGAQYENRAGSAFTSRLARASSSGDGPAMMRYFRV